MSFTVIVTDCDAVYNGIVIAWYDGHTTNEAMDANSTTKSNRLNHDLKNVLRVANIRMDTSNNNMAVVAISSPA